MNRNFAVIIIKVQQPVTNTIMRTDRVIDTQPGSCGSCAAGPSRSREESIILIVLRVCQNFTVIILRIDPIIRISSHLNRQRCCLRLCIDKVNVGIINIQILSVVRSEIITVPVLFHGPMAVIRRFASFSDIHSRPELCPVLITFPGRCHQSVFRLVKDHNLFSDEFIRINVQCVCHADRKDFT